MKYIEWGWLAVNKDGTEFIFEDEPYRLPSDADPDDKYYWEYGYYDYGSSRGYIELPKGSIEKLIGRKLTWDDKPVELKEE